MLEATILAALLLVPATSGGDKSGTELDPTAFGISLDVPPVRSFREAIDQLPIPTSGDIAIALPSYSKREQVDTGLGILSLSASSVALGITSACIRDSTCVEVNPLMRKWFNADQVGAIIGKAVLTGGTHYLVWRLMKPSKLRTVALGLMAGVNAFDAIHDVRTLRKIDRKR